MTAEVKRAGAAMGALVGAELTAPLIALLYLGRRFLDLSFPPFDVFDRLTRILPGGLITFGIDSMVAAIRTLGVSDTASAAKVAEEIMAIAIFFVGGSAAGAFLFAVLRASKRKSSLLAGLALGMAAGLAVLFLTHGLGGRASVAPVANDAWAVAVFLVWGAALGEAHRRLEPKSDSSAAVGQSDTVERVDRRQFVVRLGGAAATVTVLGAAVGALAGARRRPATISGRRWSADHSLPNVGSEIEPAPGTRPELTRLEDHYRIDIDTTVPVIDEASWRLRFDGLVDRTVELTLARIREYEPLHQFVTLACISNPIGGSLIGTTRWTGASLQRILRDVPLKAEATHLKLSSADGFFEIVALETIRADERVMLAYAWDGLPLAAKHGFPLRIYIPDLYGMKQPKWLVSIEALDHWEAGHWVKRGWDRTARMRATAVIDTVAVDMMLSQANDKTRIPIGGIAHAGARGISRVDVRVDGGPWNGARLRAPLSGTTWVIWRYDWPFTPGNHTFAVRCFDGSGAAQITDSAPPHPSGAAGVHTKSLML